MTEPPAVHSLQACLQAEAQAVEQFTALLEDEAVALTERPAFDELPALTESKNRIAQRLAELAAQRNNVLREMGLASDQAGTEAAVARHPALEPAWRSLLAGVAHARELNLRNGALIDTHLRHVQHSLDSLRAATGLGNLYDAHGRSHKIAGGKPIAAG